MNDDLGRLRRWLVRAQPPRGDLVRALVAGFIATATNLALLAGAGMPGGAVIGRTDPKGDSPVDRPITPADLAATLYSAIGIDPNYQFETPDGRPIRLVDGGRAVKELVRL